MPTFTNQATLSYNNISVNSNIVRGEVQQALIAEKTAISGTYKLNDKVTYAISIRNTGSSQYTYTVTDDLGAYSFNGLDLVPLSYQQGSVQLFINGVLQSAPIVSVGTELEIGNITVPAGGNAVLIYSAVTNEYTPYSEGSTITNTASIETDGPCSATAQATIILKEGPALTITKELSPCQLTDCTQPLCYTFTISNSGTGDAVATDNVLITDTFNPPLNISSVVFNGQTWTRGVQYTYNENTGEFATIVSQITVPSGTYTQDPETGEWSVVPGTSTLVVCGSF